MLTVITLVVSAVAAAAAASPVYPHIDSKILVSTARRALQDKAVIGEACTNALETMKSSSPTDGSADDGCKAGAEFMSTNTAVADSYKQLCDKIDFSASFGTISTCADYISAYEGVCSKITNCVDTPAGGTAGGTTAGASSTPPPGTPTASQGIVAIVQTIFFCAMGPIVLFYGPVVLRVVIFIQSLFASEYALFINTFATVTVPTIWDVFSKLVFLAVGTITLSFAAIRGEKIRGVLNGATLGILVSVPLMRFVSDLLFVAWAGCTMTGPPDKNFPNGSPTVCNQEALPFLLSFHLCKGFEWIIIFVFAKVGQHQIWVNASAAMAGASMFLGGVIDLIILILGFVNPSSIASAMIILNASRTFVSYFLAAIGAFVQYSILKTDKKPDGKTVTTLYEFGKAKRFNAFLKPPISDVLKILTILDNLIMKAMEGKMKLAPGNSLNPAAFGEAMKEMGGAMAEGVALKAAIKAAQPLLSPILAKIGLAFGDVEMIFNREITELEDAQEVASDPQAFLEKVWKMDKSTLLPKMMEKLSPKFEPYLAKVHLVWDDVKGTVNEVITGATTIGEVVEKLANPETILEHPAIKAKIEEAKATIETSEA